MAEFISAHTGDEIDAAVASGSTTTGIIKDFTTLSGSLISGSTLHIVGNATVKGNTTIDGNTTVKGNLTFGDADSDSVNFGAEISSSLVPDADGTYTIGSSAKRWKEVHTDDIKVQGDISASGDLYLAGNDLFGGTTKRLTLGATNAFVGNITSTGNIVAEGNITANRYIVSSSVTNVTTLAQSGSTIFGDTPADDTHQFTGSVFITGSSVGLIVNGNISASGDIFNTHTIQMTAASSTVINTFNTSSFQTCKYLLQVTSASSIQSSEMLVVQNSSNAFNTEYSQINSGLNLVDFTTDVNNSNVRLLGNSSFISCSVKLIRTLI